MTEVSNSVEVEFVARGAVAELFEIISEACENPPLSHPHEILLEGPAGTGKTRGALEFANWFAEEFPGVRILLTRATRASMNESVLQLYEDFVLGPSHPILVGRPMTRGHRDYYSYPWSKIRSLDGREREGQSRVVISGLDNPDRIMSTEYDLAIIFEATECGLDGLEKINSRLRARNGPVTLLICDCNPGARSHILNRRASRGLMRRFLSKHQDNPVYYNDGDWTEFWKEVYWPKLNSLTDHRRKRLLDGEWVSAEGLVVEEFNPEVHVLRGELLRDHNGSLRRTNSGKPILAVDSWNREIPMQWFAGSQDWGYRAPGSLSIWGFDSDDRAFQVYQAYHTQRQIQWWAKLASEFHRELGLRAIVCDNDKDNISIYNDHLRKVGDKAGIAMPAKKGKDSWHRSCDQLRWALTGRHPDRLVDTKEQGPLPAYNPHMFFLESNLVPGPDPVLVEKGLPVCTAEELEGLIWKSVANPDTMAEREEADPSLPDHGFDECRYLCEWKWKRGGQVSTPAAPKFRKGTLGAVLDHASVLRESWKRGG